MTDHLYPVILAGGSGTRFWPLSRHLYPKQLLRIIGDETLIQQTMRRVLSCAGPDRVLISTNPGQADSIRVQLGEWKSDLKDNYVIEPVGRNTAPAIALVAAELLRRDPEAVMLVLPADHVVTGEKAFQAAVTLGMQLAGQGHLVTFGIKPTRPETGYGYIQPNRRTTLAKKGRLSGHPVARFVEKPNRTKAAQYLKSGNYFEINRHQPQLAKAVQKVHILMTSGADRQQVEAAYKKVPSVSIDNGVMELSAHAAMIPVGFGWSDVGNWSSLEEVAPRDKAGNVVSGRVIDMDSSNSVLYADRRVVATIGLTDMVVVDTPDATLICPKSRSQDVKQMVEILKQQGAPEHLEHLTVFRPWGSYTVLEEGPGYKVKRVTVNPGGRLSLQLHHKRSEHWVVITGTARVTRGDEVLDLRVGQSTAIPVETPHRLENAGSEMLHIIEVQNGPYLGEDDIVRFQDDYGRLGRSR
ncbi:MAG: mannose-1-phosphate guanylyltransferase/mannose-6-phosphate isomerase [Nitrospira sp. NTP1]|nr:mannose-1-phosphate guanylyltransferase/mannose-6-phosphate isomerase [Nitrospira sp. NTP1]